MRYFISIIGRQVEYDKPQLDPHTLTVNWVFLSRCTIFLSLAIECNKITRHTKTLLTRFDSPFSHRFSAKNLCATNKFYRLKMGFLSSLASLIGEGESNVTNSYFAKIDFKNINLLKMLDFWNRCWWFAQWRCRTIPTGATPIGSWRFLIRTPVQHIKQVIIKKAFFNNISILLTFYLERKWFKLFIKTMPVVILYSCFECSCVWLHLKYKEPINLLG